MREILFRGQRFDNRKFIEGNYAFGYIYTSEPIIELDENYWEHSYGYAPSAEDYHLSNRFEVIPETVGQFTGITDKNGVKIFEGDIVKANFPYAKKGLVEWDKKRGSFYVNPIDGFAAYDKGYKMNANKLEIIGNIHENTELLK